MFLTDDIFNSADGLAIAAVAAAGVVGQAVVRRGPRSRDRLSDREYPTAYAGPTASVDLIRADCERSRELSRSRREAA